MSRRYPGRPPKVKVKPCDGVKAWVIHKPHLWPRPVGRDAWCPGYAGGVR